MKKIFLLLAIISTFEIYTMHISNEYPLKCINLPKPLEELIVDYVGYNNWKANTTLKGHTDAITSISISSDGTLLASGSNDKTVKLWDVPNKKELLYLDLPSKINIVTLSRDKKYLAILFSNTIISIFDNFNNKYLHKDIDFYNEITDENEEIDDIDLQNPTFSISPDNKYLIYINSLSQLLRFNIDKGSCEEIVKIDLNSESPDSDDKFYESSKNKWNHSYGNSYNVSENFDELVVVDSNLKIAALWHKYDSDTPAEYKLEKDNIIYIFPALDVFLKEQNEQQRIRDLPMIPITRNNLRRSYKLFISNSIKLNEDQKHTDEITSLIFSPNGKFLASGSKDNTIIIWENVNRNILQ